ncbi:MAG: hypothetical protein ACRD68_15675 [Pyrinomonadaceae bacterium]
MMDGTWNLEVATPFGKYPATLRFERAGGELSGHINSQLGSTPLTEITTTDGGFDAKVSLDFKGQTYDARIAGRVEGDQLDGTIKPSLIIAPTIKFTGTRS